MPSPGLRPGLASDVALRLNLPSLPEIVCRVSRFRLTSLRELKCYRRGWFYLRLMQLRFRVQPRRFVVFSRLLRIPFMLCFRASCGCVLRSVDADLLLL
jgi:hypothetical protein